MVVASMYPASRIVVKPINCEYTSMILKNIAMSDHIQDGRSQYKRLEFGFSIL